MFSNLMRPALCLMFAVLALLFVAGVCQAQSGPNGTYKMVDSEGVTVGYVQFEPASGVWKFSYNGDFSAPDDWGYYTYIGDDTPLESRFVNTDPFGWISPIPNSSNFSFVDGLGGSATLVPY